MTHDEESDGVSAATSAASAWSGQAPARRSSWTGLREDEVDLRVGQALKWLALGVLVAGLALSGIYVIAGIANSDGELGPFIMIAQFFIAGGIALGVAILAGVLAGIGAIAASGVRRERLMRAEQDARVS